jgi:hypothetical protein
MFSVTRQWSRAAFVSESEVLEFVAPYGRYTDKISGQNLPTKRLWVWFFGCL